MKNWLKFWKNKKKKPPILYIAGAVLVFCAVGAGLLCGSTSVSAADLWSMAVRGDFDSPAGRILLYVRLPRTAASLLCGGALSAAGFVTQRVLHNSLASPSIIGVNAGAGLAVTVCAALGVYGGWRLSVFAFLGAFLAALAVTVGARYWNASRGTVILMGVAVNSLLGAFSDAIRTLLPEVSVISNDFRVGEFSGVTASGLAPAAVLIGTAFVLLFLMAGELDVLSLGEESAASLGMNVGAVRTAFLVLAALLSGCAVSLCGLLSFVGLIVPHAVRRLSGETAEHLLPLCVLFGGGFVSLCDTAARTVFAPHEIPVGILMAFLGAPFFLLILLKGKGADHGA